MIGLLNLYYHWDFFSSLADSSPFVQSTNEGTIIMLLYVEHMLVTGSSSTMVSKFLVPKFKFAIKGLGDVHYFLGVEIKTIVAGLFLTLKEIC